MKYVFWVPILLFLYAVFGILTYGPQHVAVTKFAPRVTAIDAPAQKATSPSSFRIIRVVEDRSPRVSATPVVHTEKNNADLTVEIQRRLAEANCYNGADDGVWSESTREAAGRFIAAAHAELPSDHPDDGLLALLRSRGDDKSLCSTTDTLGEQANSTSPTGAQNADAMAALGSPMGLGGPSSSGYSYVPRGEDNAFRHPLGGF